MRLLEPLARGLCENRWREWAKNFAMLDAAIENVFHVGPPRISDDAAITQRARAPLGASLKPAQNFPLGDDRGGTLAEPFFVCFGNNESIVRDGARVDHLGN